MDLKLKFNNDPNVASLLSIEKNVWIKAQRDERGSFDLVPIAIWSCIREELNRLGRVKSSYGGKGSRREVLFTN